MHEPQISTRFGTVTPTYVRVPCPGRHHRSEELTTRHITGVRYELDRSPTVAVIVGTVGLAGIIAGFVAGTSATAIFGLIAVAFAVVMALPRPRITLHTADGRTHIVRGKIGTVDEAATFVSAVRSYLAVQHLPPPAH